MKKLIALLLLCSTPVFGGGVGGAGAGSVDLTPYAPLVSPTLTTPVLGAATGSTLALGGASLGSHRFALTGDGSTVQTAFLKLAIGETDSVNKYGGIVIPSYLNASTPALAFWCSNTSGNNRLLIGGGSGSFSAVNAIDFYTAATVGTQTGTLRWQMTGAGHFIATTDNTLDIGASGATRPRSLYVGTDGNFGGALNVTGTVTAAAADYGSAVIQDKVLAYHNGNIKLGLGLASGVMRIFSQTSATLAFGQVSTGDGSTFTETARFTPLLGFALGSTTDPGAGNLAVLNNIVTTAAAPTIASATTIAPTKMITFISGTTAIATITAPAGITATGGTITLIPTGIFTTTTAGNIALASTAVVSRVMTMTYDVTTVKWYPSY